MANNYVNVISFCFKIFSLWPRTKNMYVNSFYICCISPQTWEIFLRNSLTRTPVIFGVHVSREKSDEFAISQTVIPFFRIQRIENVFLAPMPLFSLCRCARVFCRNIFSYLNQTCAKSELLISSIPLERAKLVLHMLYDIRDYFLQ